MMQKPEYWPIIKKYMNGPTPPSVTNKALYSQPKKSQLFSVAEKQKPCAVEAEQSSRQTTDKNRSFQRGSASKKGKCSFEKHISIILRFVRVKTS